jgi:hypothetical protein
MDRVTPNLEHVPKRTYIRKGGNIVCREVLGTGEGIDLGVSDGQFLFRIWLSVGNAKLLMEDLYYGEYTGA